MYSVRFAWWMVIGCGLAALGPGCPGPSLVDGGTGTDPSPAAFVVPTVEAARVEPAADCVLAGLPASPTQRAMLEALNTYRADHGLRPLIYSQRLEAAADTYLRDLSLRGFFDHVDPEGQDPGERAVAAGFCHHYVGENLAAGQVSVEAVMAAWTASREHNDNMLEPAYVYVGVGAYVDASGRTYWAQEFAYQLP